MNSHEFRDTSERALSGDRTALEAILLLYMPLINRYSRIDGELARISGSTYCCTS